MNKFSFITQIGMVVVAVIIVLMYIQPKISSIRGIQDLTTKYEIETQNVSQINEDLKNKITSIEAINLQDTQALVRFMPDSVDEIAVLKDLSLILESQAVSFFDVAFKGSSVGKQTTEDVVNEYNSANEYAFTLSFESTYTQLKNILSQIEANNYLLQVANLKISEGTQGSLKVDLNLISFARASTTAVVAP